MRNGVLVGLLAVAWSLGAAAARAQGPEVVVPTNVAAGAAPYNALVLQQIRAMPALGGYSASHAASVKLGGSVSLDALTGLNVLPAQAQPSYCSGATYLVFLKAVNTLVARGEVPRDERTLAPLLIAGQRDGEGVWGRWNANGPGTARLFYQLGLGPNFSEWSRAQAGDFMKIFWNNNVGRREHGHSVVFLGEETANGVPSVRFWSSNLGVGYSEKVVPKAKIAAVVFSRLTNPRGVVRAGTLAPRVDPYLASLLTADSSMAEVRQQCGMP